MRSRRVRDSLVGGGVGVGVGERRLSEKGVVVEVELSLSLSLPLTPLFLRIFPHLGALFSTCSKRPGKRGVQKRRDEAGNGRARLRSMAKRKKASSILLFFIIACSSQPLPSSLLPPHPLIDPGCLVMVSPDRPEMVIPADSPCDIVPFKSVKKARRKKRKKKRGTK